MKSFQSILCALLLTLSLSSAAFAATGQISGAPGQISGAPGQISGAPGQISGFADEAYDAVMDLFGALLS